MHHLFSLLNQYFYRLLNLGPCNGFYGSSVFIWLMTLPSEPLKERGFLRLLILKRKVWWPQKDEKEKKKFRKTLLFHAGNWTRVTWVKCQSADHYTKGQTNSKLFFQKLTFLPKKRTNKFDFTTCRLVFLRFLEESEDTKKTFRN